MGAQTEDRRITPHSTPAVLGWSGFFVCAYLRKLFTMFSRFAFGKILLTA
jgi:hypothetical protein